MDWANFRHNLARVAVATGVVLTVLIPAVPASASSRDEEKEFVERLNGLRATHGLNALTVDYRLRSVARAWSQKMADAGSISHNPSLSSQLPSEWRTAGENVGVGPTVLSLHNAFVASPHHYDNMIHGEYESVGIGVVDQGGRIWVSVEFMYSGKATPADPENPPSSTPLSFLAMTSRWNGYRIVASNGRIFGATTEIQSASAQLLLNQPIVGAASTPSRNGEWTVAGDGGIFSFGDAAFHGSMGGTRLNKPIVGMASTPSGNGYWMVASDGGIFSFGDAAFFGSTGSLKLNKPIVGMGATPSGNGYWLVASDGGIFAFGDATFYGSTGSLPLVQPVVAMSPSSSGHGYWMVARDGGIFCFGDAGFHGSLGGQAVSGGSVVGMSLSDSGSGYVLVSGNGSVYTFGDAPYEGGASAGASIAAVSG